MLKSERQDEILRVVWQQGTASSSDLASYLGVSEITIRRDLDELARSGRLERVRGGARRILPQGPEPPVIQRQAEQAREKRAIGLAAVAMVEDGSVIGIESGSTGLELARAIAARCWQSLHVITNSFGVADLLMRTPGVHLVFVGGSVNADEMGTFGSLAAEMLARINIDRLFMTCRGIDARAGVTNDASAEGTFTAERALVRASREVIVLADHTKLGRVFPLQSIPISDVDGVVTDALAPAEQVEELRAQGVRVTIAPLPEPTFNSAPMEAR